MEGAPFDRSPAGMESPVFGTIPTKDIRSRTRTDDADRVPTLSSVSTDRPQVRLHFPLTVSLLLCLSDQRTAAILLLSSHTS